MSFYSNKVAAWAESNEKSAPSYADKFRDFKDIARSGKVDDSTLGFMADALYQGFKKGNSEEHKRTRDIEIKTFRNQYGVRFVDMSGQYGELCIYRDSAGMPYVKGNREIVPLLMGRAELDVAFRRMVDGNYFNDK